MMDGGRKRSVSGSNKGPFRSVVDYDTENQLRSAMMAVGEGCNPELFNMIAEIQEGQPVQKVARTSELQSAVAENLDWVLPCFDPDTTEAQSMKDELKRLQVLKSYLILDSKREEAFERITSLAARIFDVPIAIVSLVDLGRAWSKSAHGIGEAGDTPRKFSICAHAIMSTNKIFVVPDATLDFRFRDNPFVLGPPHVRFYAGAPLVSPEGYKLGTFCIIDSIARPHGLSVEQTNTLTDLADMTIKVMVDRRFQMERREVPAQLIAYTAHDLLTPLTGVQLSLTILKDDEGVKAALGEHQLELIDTAASCSDLMIRICHNALDGLRQSTANAASDMLTTHSGGETGILTTKVEDLVKSLHMIVDPIPKKVPCIITLEPSVPNVIVGDDLKLFRSALNLLTNAIDRTVTGTVHLTIRPDQDSLLLFECEDTGADIPVEEYQYLFQPIRHDDVHLRVGLSSIASLISSLDGEYGFRPRGIDADGRVLTDSKGRRQSGSIFWFSIPLYVPEMLDPIGALTTMAVAAQPNSVFDGHGTCYASVSMAELQHKLPAVPLNMVHERSPFAVEDSLSAGVLDDNGLGAAFESSTNLERESNCDAAIVSLALARTNISSVFESTMECGRNNDAAVASLVMVRSNVPEADKDTMGEDTRFPTRMAQLANLEPFPLDGLAEGNSEGIRRRRALVIEDSLVVRKSLAHAFNSLGFDVTQARDGMEGLKELKQALFDIVLCDFLMPVMDGLDCVKQYRDWEKQNRPWDSQLIIGISAHANMNDSGQGLQAGMDAFHTKPITIKTLTDLQGISEAVLRTRKLDEWESSMSGANLVDSEPTAYDLRSLFGSDSANGTAAGRTTVPMCEPVTVRMCLIATDAPTMQSNPLPEQLEAMGWKAVVINNGADCLRLLQMRNWDAVLIDDDLPELPGASCITEFRKWEEQNRVNGQKNIFLVCDSDIPSPSDKHSWIQPPNGCNGVLRKPVPLNDFKYLLHATGGMDIVVRAG